MKKSGFVLAMLLYLASAGHAMSLDKLFRKYSYDDRFEYTSVGKGVMNVFSMFADYSLVTDGLMEKVTGVKVLKLDSDSADQHLSTSFISDIDNVIDDGKFDTTLEKRGKGERTYVYQRVDKKLNSDLLVLTRDKYSVTLVWLKGKMNPEEMRRQKEAENEENYDM